MADTFRHFAVLDAVDSTPRQVRDIAAKVPAFSRVSVRHTLRDLVKAGLVQFTDEHFYRRYYLATPVDGGPR
jgi:DNA-binding IclR family transcriptional regulator